MLDDYPMLLKSLNSVKMPLCWSSYCLRDSQGGGHSCLCAYSRSRSRNELQIFCWSASMEHVAHCDLSSSQFIQSFARQECINKTYYNLITFQILSTALSHMSFDESFLRQSSAGRMKFHKSFDAADPAAEINCAWDLHTVWSTLFHHDFIPSPQSSHTYPMREVGQWSPGNDVV